MAKPKPKTTTKPKGYKKSSKVKDVKKGTNGK